MHITSESSLSPNSKQVLATSVPENTPDIAKQVSASSVPDNPHGNCLSASQRPYQHPAFIVDLSAASRQPPTSQQTLNLPTLNQPPTPQPQPPQTFYQRPTLQQASDRLLTPRIPFRHPIFIVNSSSTHNISHSTHGNPGLNPKIGPIIDPPTTSRLSAASHLRTPVPRRPKPQNKYLASPYRPLVPASHRAILWTSPHAQAAEREWSSTISDNLLSKIFDSLLSSDNKARRE
ncbi:hypothetical protein C0992_010925 [Termitomyces sp. T32_za158]|nr:hypothetical protein C0992_010925 [Termitomyces sp. T32_za158]